MAEEEKKNETSGAAVSEAKEVKTDSKTKEGVTPFAQRTPSDGLLLVKIYTPFQTFYEDDAYSLSATNETGPFDVLPGHHNFITMLIVGTVKVVNAEKETKEIPVTRGLMHIRDNKLIIFMDV